MTLETRLCGCGCNVKFRVLPTSKQIFASKDCELKKSGMIEVQSTGRRKYVSPPQDGMVGSQDMARMIGLNPNNFDYWTRKLQIPFYHNGTRHRWFKPEEARAIWRKHNG